MKRKKWLNVLGYSAEKDHTKKLRKLMAMKNERSRYYVAMLLNNDFSGGTFDLNLTLVLKNLELNK